MSSENSYDGLPTGDDFESKNGKDAPPAYDPTMFESPPIVTPESAPPPFSATASTLPLQPSHQAIELQSPAFLQPYTTMTPTQNVISGHFSPRPAADSLLSPLPLHTDAARYPTAVRPAAYPPCPQPTYFRSPAAAPLLPDTTTPYINMNIPDIKTVPLSASWDPRYWSYVTSNPTDLAQEQSQAIPLTAYNPGDPLDGPMLDLGPLTSKYPIPLNHAISGQDQQQFPESAALYRRMVAVVGARNIIPPPAWLDRDEFRVWWLKSDFNALPYFLTISPEVKDELQQLLDKGMCVSCCRGSPLTSAAQNCCGITPCSYFWLEMFCCPFGDWYTLDDQAAFYMPRAPHPYVTITRDSKGRRHTHDHTFSNTVCCYCGDSTTAWRKYVVQTWQAAGLTYDETECAACCKASCCKPCISAQHAEIAMHYYARRYGPALLFDPLKSTASRVRNPHIPMLNENNALTRYLDDTHITTQHSPTAAFHPYSNKETPESYFSTWFRRLTYTPLDPARVSNEQMADRHVRFNWFLRCAGPNSSQLRPGHESQYRYWYSPLPAFAEWLDLPSAVREHQRRWFRFGFLEL